MDPKGDVSRQRQLVQEGAVGYKSGDLGGNVQGV